MNSLSCQTFSPLPSLPLPPSHLLQSDASGDKLKDLAIEMGLTPSAVTYLKQKVPKKTSVAGRTLLHTFILISVSVLLKRCW